MENNENNFEFVDNNSNNSFKKSTSKIHNSKGGGFGKTVLVPFLSGLVGATLVVGTCFGVPSIKEKILDSSTTSSSKLTTSTSSSSSDATYINLSDYSNTSISVAEAVLPSVVGITVTYQVSSIFGSSTGEATGSGIIVTEDGYIVTNNHVIASESSSSYYALSEATSIEINLYNDSETYQATIVGTDSYTDIAVLKIDKTDLTPAVLGDSTTVKVGEWVMAIGNPLGMDYSVTTGVVSAIDREVESEGTTYTTIQTDAAINSGNSGGALVNANGEVIGINTLKLSGTDVEGIGFAIPISDVTSVIEQLIEYQTVKRPYIGISGSAVDETTSERYNIPLGVYVEGVEEGSPAEDAGLQKGDIITKIEGTEVTSVTELNTIKNKYSIGDTVTLTVYRDNTEIEVQVTLAETPEEDTTTTDSSTSTSQNSSSSVQSPQDSTSGSIFDYFR